MVFGAQRIKISSGSELDNSKTTPLVDTSSTTMSTLSPGATDYSDYYGYIYLNHISNCILHRTL